MPTVEIDAGVCGFVTRAEAATEDHQHVTLDVTSPCENITRLADALDSLGPIDVYEDLGLGAEGALLRTVRDTLPPGCAACAVPTGLFKLLQVTTGLALPKDITISLTNE
jgi:hypothetical protein